jgi:glycosyltransferase involved in cell wall biosynthesis
VFSTGYRAFSKGQHREFFSSLQRQNYSNFHVVFVDDNSPAGEVEGILKYIQRENMSFAHRLELLHTNDHIGSLANKFFFIRKYCNAEDVVVNIDSDDHLIGTQVFQVLNSFYKDPKVWFAYTKFIIAGSSMSDWFQGYSKELGTSPT